MTTLEARRQNPAAAKLADLARCKGIRVFQAGDNDVLCGSCMLPIISSRGGWIHDPDANRALREHASEGQWPR